jgi:hypothetical protein
VKIVFASGSDWKAKIYLLHFTELHVDKS